MVISLLLVQMNHCLVAATLERAGGKCEARHASGQFVQLVNGMSVIGRDHTVSHEMRHRYVGATVARLSVEVSKILCIIMKGDELHAVLSLFLHLESLGEPFVQYGLIRLLVLVARVSL